MKLSELIAQVGDDNIQVQVLGTSLVSAKVKTKDSEITFATDREKGMALVGLGKETHHCMIIWMPINKLPTTTRDKS